MVLSQPANTPGLDVEEQLGAQSKYVEEPANEPAGEDPQPEVAAPADPPKVELATAEVATVPQSDGPFLTREFVITFNKEPSKGLGLDISAHDGATLLVGKVKEGPVQIWNETVGDPFEKVRRGDRILSVNSQSGNADLILETLKKANGETKLVMRRVIQFQFVCSKKREQSRGFDYDDNADKLIVTNITQEGPLKDGNKKNKADTQIAATDEIIEVNGVKGNRQALLDAFELATGELNLIVRRADGKS